MGLRYRKSVKIAPGVKINFNKKSASVTVGSGPLFRQIRSSQPVIKCLLKSEKNSLYFIIIITRSAR